MYDENGNFILIEEESLVEKTLKEKGLWPNPYFERTTKRQSQRKHKAKENTKRNARKNIKES